jgi:outer membrane protein OmpA-like peptidoglycan-associated protein
MSCLLLIAGCASNQAPPELEKQKQTLNEMENSPVISQYAPIERDEYSKLVAKTEEAWQKHKDELYKHNLYLAERQADITRGTADAKNYQEKIRESAQQRQAMLQQSQQDQLSSAKNRALSAEDKINQLAQELENAKTKKTDRGTVLTLSSILFESGTAEIKPGSERTLEKLATYLKEYPELKVVIEGFTDSVGPAEFNKQLSENRARSVMQALSENGVDESRVSAVGRGESYPVTDNTTPAGRQQNRRVELIINEKSAAS